MIVIDTSVFTDFFIEFEVSRHTTVVKFIDVISERDVVVYEPFVFEVELGGILRRKFDEKTVFDILSDLKSKIEIVEEHLIHNLALEIAIKTHGRAIDSYFAATAKFTNSILVSCDRIMVNNARKAGIEAYYLIGEFDNAVEIVRKF